MKKLLQNMRESVAGNVLEAVIIFVPVVLILQLTLPEFLICILARLSFSWLFLSGNIPIALLVLYLCRNILQYAELNNR